MLSRSARARDRCAVRSKCAAGTAEGLGSCKFDHPCPHGRTRTGGSDRPDAETPARQSVSKPCTKKADGTYPPPLFISDAAVGPTRCPRPTTGGRCQTIPRRPKKRPSLDTDWRGRGRCADSSGRSVRFASAMRLDPLDQRGSDAASDGLENSRSHIERRTQSQSRQWRATVPSAAPIAPKSSPCASPPRDSRECTRSGDSVHEGRPQRSPISRTVRRRACSGGFVTRSVGATLAP